MDIEESLHPWDKAQLVMIYDLLNMFLDSFLKKYIYLFIWPPQVSVVSCRIFVAADGHSSSDPWDQQCGMKV